MHPSSSLATLRPDLGGSVEEFSLAMDREGFIGLQVLPVFDTAQQAGSFGRIPLKELLKNRETRRAPGARYASGDWSFEPVTYATEEHGVEAPVDDRESKMYAQYFDAELAAAEMARDIVLRNYERRVADKVFNASTFTPHAVANEWDDADNATPIVDVEAAAQAMWSATGLWPNALIISRKVFRNLRLCAEIANKIKQVMSVLPGDINVAHLQAAFDIENILVAGGAKNIANEGQDASISQIWSGEYAMLTRVATGRNIKEPCLGRTLHWAADGSSIGAAIETYRGEDRRSNIIRARMDTDERFIYEDAAYLLSNITT